MKQKKYLGKEGKLRWILYLVSIISITFLLIVQPPKEGIGQRRVTQEQVRREKEKASRKANTKADTKADEELTKKAKELEYKLQAIKYIDKLNEEISKIIKRNTDTIYKESKIVVRRAASLKKVPEKTAVVYKTFPVLIPENEVEYFIAKFPTDTISTLVIPLKRKKVNFLEKIVNLLKKKSKKKKQ